ncbi:MAG: DUF5777 family beta-barrel protein [Cyclobacteriaceae bacterium]|nr:DUF5777 family beta-barrel protein [Cyclobacteriaceae bacterium]
MKNNFNLPPLRSRFIWRSNLFLFIFFCSIPSFAQNDLLEMLDEDEDEDTEYAVAAFKGTHIINGHSTKTKSKGELDFLIYHRFGPINGGIQEFFGLDQANMRLGFEYGITDEVDVGIGRSSFEKTYDIFLKWKLLKQKSGVENSPVSITFLTSIALPTNDIAPDLSTAQRLGYVNQLMFSRKFNSKLTIQLMPGLVYLNTVPQASDNSSILYVGGAYRYKLTKGVALTGEYYYRFNPIASIETYDVVGFGVDLETGGHVFQLHISNSRTTFEKGFITDTVDDFWDGDIRFGFNISRTFQLGKKRKLREETP